MESIEHAAAYVERVGLALVYPKADLVLPSLWQELTGSTTIDWAERDDDGNFLAFTPEFGRLWDWKDELPERRLVCAGRHLGRGSASLIATRLLAAVYALCGRRGLPEDFREEELGPLEREVAEAVLEHGPLSAPELRELLGTADRKGVEKAVTFLQRRLVLTNAGVVRQEQGWPAIQQDVFARRWGTHLRKLPSVEDARRSLAAAVLSATEDASAADLAAALGWRRKQATGVLGELVSRGAATVREAGEIELWSSV
ncbi:MAG: hypothetical protein M3R70_12280 [Actinomycetota bacterium]|nr:hypothetical protein [Actinomycetota bacterium]